MAAPRTKKPDADDKIMQLLAKVKAQKEAIAQAERPTYKTNMTFSFVDGNLSQAVNLRVVTDLGQLLKIAAHVRSAAASYEEAGSAILGPDEKPPAFLWCNFSAVEWTHDIKLRVGQIRIKSQRERLHELEQRLDSILTPERRRELELLAIERELSGEKTS